MRGWLVAVLAGVVLCSGAPAFAEKRVALVVGNGAYRHVPALPNPGNDASDIAASLERLGFSIRRVTNGSYDDMRRALLDFSQQTRDADMAVVFFAGHGMEIGGENWLIPIDARLQSDVDAEQEAVGLKSVLNIVARASKLGLVILDACRNNPFAAKMTRSIRTRAVDRGFARVEPTDNVLVAYAAKDGTTAADGTGRNSPFTASLLKHLETPGLEVRLPAGERARRRDRGDPARAAALHVRLAVEGAHFPQGRCAGAGCASCDRCADRTGARRDHLELCERHQGPRSAAPLHRAVPCERAAQRGGGAAAVTGAGEGRGRRAADRAGDAAGRGAAACGWSFSRSARRKAFSASRGTRAQAEGQLQGMR